MVEEVAIIAYKFGLSGTYIEDMPRLDRKKMLRTAIDIIKAENPKDANGKQKFDFEEHIIR